MNVGNYRQQLEAVKRRNKAMKDADKMLAAAIGDFLRRRRLEQDLKLRHIAKATGLSIARIYSIEMGKGKLLDDATFQKFLKAVAESRPTADNMRTSLSPTTPMKPRKPLKTLVGDEGLEPSTR